MNGDPGYPSYAALRWLADSLEQLLAKLADEYDRMAADRTPPAFRAGWMRSGVRTARSYFETARRIDAAATEDDPGQLAGAAMEEGEKS